MRLFKPLIVFAILVTASILWAKGVCFYAGGTVTSDDCSGDLMWSWNMEDFSDTTAGNPGGCTDGSGDTTPTLSGNAGNVYRSGVQKSNGTYSMRIEDGTADYYTFDVTTDIFNEAEGKITIDLYITEWIDTHQYFHIRDEDANEYIYINLNGTNNTDIEAYVYIVAGGNTDFMETADGDKGLNEWLRVTYQWKLSETNDHRIVICDLTPPDTLTNCSTTAVQDSLATWNGNPTLMKIGGIGAGSPDFYIDNVKIYATSGL